MGFAQEEKIDSANAITVAKDSMQKIISDAQAAKDSPLRSHPHPALPSTNPLLCPENSQEFKEHYRKIMGNIAKILFSLFVSQFLGYLLINYWLELVNQHLRIIINIIFG